MLLAWIVGGLLLAALLLLVAGQLGALTGTAPADLGVHDGRLKPPSSTPNSVSSQASLYAGQPGADYAAIAPIPLPADDPTGQRTLDRIAAWVEATPGGHVVERGEDYLRASFTTRWLKFVDDAEFWVDRGTRVVQLRSASRLGRSDLGVNRRRMEMLRSALPTQRP